MSTTGAQTFTLSNDEKIALLEELHRPLEEHWAVRTKYGLDAKSSEYIYKHHITRLEDIYTNHKTHNTTTPGLLYMSPVSQLYGINGLNVDDNPDKQKKKEQKWVNNFQKHAFLSDGGGGDHDEKNKTTSKSASYSPGKMRTSYSAGSTRHEKRKADSEEQNRNTRSKCFDPSVSPEDLLMLGLYRLDEEQEDIYRRFVDMISTFDDFDKANIVADVMKDAHGEDDLLEGFGGTELPPGPVNNASAPLPPLGASQQPLPPPQATRSGHDFRPNSANGRRQ